MAAIGKAAAYTIMDKYDAVHLLVMDFDSSIVESIELRMIRPSKFPVRYDNKDSPESVNLKKSIREHGLLQPILVRPLEHGFEIVAGHRRFAACRGLRWRFIPCKIREFTDRQAYEIQLVENIQRKSMDPIEEAEAYQRYVVDHGWGGVTALAGRIGKSQEYVSHRMQLLRLSPEIRQKIADSSLGVSQALELTGMDPASKDRLADQIIDNRLTVKQIRRIKSSLERPEGAEQASRELSIVRKSILALRISLSRIDDLIDDVHRSKPKNRTELIDHLMELRRSIHSMIDQSLRYKKRL